MSLNSNNNRTTIIYNKEKQAANTDSIRTLKVKIVLSSRKPRYSIDGLKSLTIVRNENKRNRKIKQKNDTAESCVKIITRKLPTWPISVTRKDN